MERDEVERLREVVIDTIKADEKPIVPHSYGVGEFSFCLEKIVLKHRLGKRQPLNYRMYIGRMLHEKILPDIVKKFYGKRGWKFEKRLKFKVPNSTASIEGFIDAYSKKRSKVIEFKTTHGRNEYTVEDPLSQAYIMQGNAYAGIVGAKTWEIWIVGVRFDNPDDITVTRFVGEFGPEVFEEYLDRVRMVEEALNSDKDLSGPEFDFECRNCVFAPDCPIVGSNRSGFEDWLAENPEFRKRDLPSEYSAEFDRLRKEGKLVYDRSRKVWRYTA